MKVQTSPRIIHARMRQEAALRLRASGVGYETIARRLGYRSRASAYKAVRRGLEATRDRAAVAFRVLLYLKMERQVEALLQLVEAEDFAGITRLLDDKIVQAEQEVWRSRRWMFLQGA